MDRRQMAKLRTSIFEKTEWTEPNGEATDDSFLLKLSIVFREQNIELNKRNSKLSKDLEDKDSGYNKQVLDDVELIFYKNKNCVQQPRGKVKKTVKNQEQEASVGKQATHNMKNNSSCCIVRNTVLTKRTQHHCTWCHDIFNEEVLPFEELCPKCDGKLDSWSPYFASSNNRGHKGSKGCGNTPITVLVTNWSTQKSIHLATQNPPPL